jgi:hypothetical protein
MNMNDLIPTTEQLNRATKEYSEIAGEQTTVKWITGKIYVFCLSELGALRIEHKMKIGHADYSVNCKVWYWTK